MKTVDDRELLLEYVLFLRETISGIEEYLNKRRSEWCKHKIAQCDVCGKLGRIGKDMTDDCGAGCEGDTVHYDCNNYVREMNLDLECW